MARRSGTRVRAGRRVGCTLAPGFGNAGLGACVACEAPAVSPSTNAVRVFTNESSPIAWADSSSLVAAASSELAALDCVSLSICATAVFICSIHSACWLLAADTSDISVATLFTPPAICSKKPATSEDTATPCSAF